MHPTVYSIRPSGRRMESIIRSLQAEEQEVMEDNSERLRFSDPKILQHGNTFMSLLKAIASRLKGDDYACPYFWPIGDRYIMPFFSHMSGGQYLLGDYDKEKDKFLVSSHGKFNWGAVGPAGVHAPSAAPDGKGGVILILNVNQGKPTGEWNHVMTLPRQLTLVGKDEVHQEPTGDIESLRYNKQSVGADKATSKQRSCIEKYQRQRDGNCC